jgi:hypothetical protein
MHLEELKFSVDDITAVSLPPTIKRIKFSVYECPTIENMINILRLPNIEEIEILTNTDGTNQCLIQMKDELRMREDFKGLKKFVFLSFQDRRVVFDVLCNSTN